MKILLINPNQIHLVNSRGRIYNRAWPPLELCNCAALLEQQGHEVRILDANALKISLDKVIHSAKGFDKIFINSSSMDRWQCPNVDIGPFLETVAGVREIIDEIYILGAHGTIIPGEILELTRARAVVRGEPELTVLEICRGRQLKDIHGLAFRENGKICITPAQSPLDLKDLPTPAFHLLPMDQYYYEVLGSNFTIFEGSRGCANRCTFCLLEMYGKGVRNKPVENIISEIDYAISRFNVKNAYFFDLEFTVFRKKIMELCDYLINKKYDFHWTCQTRLDLVDELLLRKMKQAGCRLIHFGVESGSDDLLKRINKKITVKEIEEGMRLIHRAGIESACFFMLGFPVTDLRDMEQTIRFAKRLNPTYALFKPVVPYPGTILHNQLIESGRDFSDDDLFPESCMEGEDLVILKKTVRRAYMRYYLRPRYIISRLSKGDIRSLSRQVKLLWSYFAFGAK